MPQAPAYGRVAVDAHEPTKSGGVTCSDINQTLQTLLLVALVGILGGVLIIANRDDNKVSLLVEDARSTGVLAAMRNATDDFASVHDAFPALMKSAVHIVGQLEAIATELERRNTTALVDQFDDAGESFLANLNRLMKWWSAMAPPPAPT